MTANIDAAMTGVRVEAPAHTAVPTLDVPASPVGVVDVSAVDVPAVDVEPQDTDGRLLRLQTQPTRHVSVANRLLVGDGLSLHLEILAASHRVGLHGDNLSVHETVACAPVTACATVTACAPETVGDRLPERHRWTADGWAVEFSSAFCFGSDAVDDAAAAVGKLSTADPDNSVLRRFPGHPLALTALNADLTRADQVSWRSWHLYPGTDPHVVTTVTTATRQERRP